MCRSCYVSTFSAISAGSAPPSSTSTQVCKNYHNNTAMSQVPPEMIWARLDAQKEEKERAKAQAKATKAAKKNSKSNNVETASIYSDYTTYSFDKDARSNSTLSEDSSSTKKSMSSRLKHAFK